MKPLDLDAVRAYVENNIGEFHTKRLEKIERLRLDAVLARKNPYLFKAKYVLTAEQLVRGILDAYLSSQEETIFGDFMEGLAIFVCEQVYGGYKPLTGDLTGIDIVFQKDGHLYIVEVKSGPNWGNSSQINRMVTNFEAARQKLAADYPGLSIIPVNGCCYGRENNPQRSKGYWKLCGQDFWQFISGNDQLYVEIIEPLGYRAKQRNEAFDQAYARIVNRFTLAFSQDYCNDAGDIDWIKLTEFVSRRNEGNVYPDLAALD